MILDWSRLHTFYTQNLCNKVFSLSQKRIDVALVQQACHYLLKINEPVFYQYRQLLTPGQWNFLIAVANEGDVSQITSQKFISKYNIGTPANARRISQSLLEKELLLEETGKAGVTYRVYDVLLSRWLQLEY